MILLSMPMLVLRPMAMMILLPMRQMVMPSRARGLPLVTSLLRPRPEGPKMGPPPEGRWPVIGHQMNKVTRVPPDDEDTADADEDAA